MIRNDKLLFMITACLCLWGCARVSSNQTRENERIKFLEAKVNKLEEDFRTAAAARDTYQQQAAGLEEQRANLEKVAAALTKERDEALAQMTARTAERDTMQTQYDSFRKELRALLGHADAAASRPNPQPVTAAPAQPASGQTE